MSFQFDSNVPELPKVGNSCSFATTVAYIRRIFSKGTLRAFWEAHPDARAALEFWYDTVDKTSFAMPNDVLQFFNTADTVGNGRVVFNIAHNKYRLVVKFEYERQFAFVRFIGTHKEYDRLNDIANL